MVKLLFLILNYKTYLDTIRVTNEILYVCSENTKILIVDNASPNESYEEITKVFADNAKVDVILSSENSGYAKGNNYGLRYAKKYNAEYVCIINNDVHFSWETMQSLMEWYTKLEKPAFVAPVQKLPGDVIAAFPELIIPSLAYDIRMNTIFFSPKKHKYKSNTIFPNVQEVGFIPGAFLFTKYEVFESLGFFFEETFLFCEERFTGRRVKDAGLKNYIITDLFYLHEHSKTIKNEASEKKQRQMIQEGRKKYYRVYSRTPKINGFILDIFFYFHEFELFILKLIK